MSLLSILDWVVPPITSSSNLSMVQSARFKPLELHSFVQINYQIELFDSEKKDRNKKKKKKMMMMMMMKK